LLTIEFNWLVYLTGQRKAFSTVSFQSNVYNHTCVAFWNTT
jgi:hypothetical protein